MCAAVAPISEKSKAVRQEQLLKVLDPIVRLARHSGMSSYDIIALVRESILDTTLPDELRDPDNAPTCARAAVSSGLSKSEVQAVWTARRERYERALADRHIEEAAVRVANAWGMDARFSGPYGTPLRLPLRRTSLRNESPSFQDLVRSVAPNLDFQVVLNSLMASGAVSWADEEQSMVVLSAGFASVLDQGDDRTFQYVTRTLAGMARTLATNAYDLYPGPKLFERRAFGDHVLDQAGLEFVNERMRTKLSSSLESIVDELDGPVPEPENEPDIRCSVGIYVISEPNDAGFVTTAPPKKRVNKTIDLVHSAPGNYLAESSDSDD